jgi:hypothetical protein
MTSERILSLEKAKNLSRNIELVHLKEKMCREPMAVEGYWEFIEVSEKAFE